MNKVTLIGRLGLDPEYNNDHKRTNLRVATSYSRTNEDGEKEQRTEWHNCVAWGDLSSRAAASLKKGDAIIIVGRNQTRSYENQNGEKRTSTEVVVMFLGKQV